MFFKKELPTDIEQKILNLLNLMIEDYKNIASKSYSSYVYQDINIYQNCGNFYIDGVPIINKQLERAILRMFSEVRKKWEEDKERKVYENMIKKINKINEKKQQGELSITKKAKTKKKKVKKNVK